MFTPWSMSTLWADAKSMSTQSQRECQCVCLSGRRSPQRANLRKLNRGSGARGARPAAADSAAPPRTDSASRASSPTRSTSPSPSRTTAVQASPRRPSAFSPYQQQQQSLQYRTAQKVGGVCWPHWLFRVATKISMSISLTFA